MIYMRIGRQQTREFCYIFLVIFSLISEFSKITIFYMKEKVISSFDFKKLNR